MNRKITGLVLAAVFSLTVASAQQPATPPAATPAPPPPAPVSAGGVPVELKDGEALDTARLPQAGRDLMQREIFVRWEADGLREELPVVVTAVPALLKPSVWALLKFHVAWLANRLLA